MSDKQAGEKCLIGKQNEYVQFFTKLANESRRRHTQNPFTKANRRHKRNCNAQSYGQYIKQVGGNMADPYFTKKPSHSLQPY